MSETFLCMLLLLVTLIGVRPVNPDFLFVSNEQRFEGDPCQMRDGGKGLCRKTQECSQVDRKRELRCEFTNGNVPTICCPLAPNKTFEASARIVEEGCVSVKPIRREITDHVIAGTEARVGEFPFMGLIKYEIPEVRCGAALVTNRFMVTAAHCFKSNVKPVEVLLGTIDVTDADPVLYPIAKVTRHPEYNKQTKLNDIAMIQLGQTVAMNDNVQPICLYTGLIDLEETQNLILMGWGVVDTETMKSSNSLLKGDVSIVLRSTCQALYEAQEFTIKLSEKQLCAVGKTKIDGLVTDGCQGDSGGPLVMLQDKKYYLVGVVSTGTGCGSDATAGIYTRVASYLNWISDTAWGS